MRDSKDRFFLLIIMILVLLVAIVLIMWVRNSADSLMNNISGNNKLNISSSTHICTAEEKNAKICTMEYAPVCGIKENCGNQTWCKENNIPCGVCSEEEKTYATGCVACSSGVDSWTQGECNTTK